MNSLNKPKPSTYSSYIPWILGIIAFAFFMFFPWFNLLFGRPPIVKSTKN